MERNWLVINKKDNNVTELTIEGTIGSYWKDNKEAILTKEEMAQQLKNIANIESSHIIVNINSYGGDVNHGISIHDLLANHKAKVTTKVNGLTASAATIIAMAADKGERRISSNALFLIHKASTFAMGNKNDMELVVSDLSKVDQNIANIYAKRSGKTQTEMLDLMDKFNGRGEWLSAEEAKKNGLVDEIFEPMKAAAFIDKEILLRFGLPEIPENKINTNPIENKMKKILLAGLAAFAAFFGKKTEDEMEFSQEDAKKVNDELELRATSIATLTGERDALKAENDTNKAAKVKAEADLATANTTIADLNAKIAAAATPPATPGKEKDIIETKNETDADFDTIDNLPHNKEADKNRV